MTEQEQITVLALCDAADRMRAMINARWAADNPEDAAAIGVLVPAEDDVSDERYSEAWRALERATYYARRAVERSK